MMVKAEIGVTLPQTKVLQRLAAYHQKPGERPGILSLSQSSVRTRPADLFIVSVHLWNRDDSVVKPLIWGHLAKAI